MIRLTIWKIAAFLAILCGLPLSAFAGEETFEGLDLVTDNTGHVTSISVSNPGTTLNIEKEFVFSLSPDGSPTSGKITFRDNVQRTMKDGELKLYFEQFGGLTAVWDYYSQHGNAVSFNLGSQKVPSDAYGKVSRLILSDGKQLVGRLGKITDQAEGFTLTIEGASGGPIQFYNGVVKEIQQMK